MKVRDSNGKVENFITCEEAIEWLLARSGLPAGHETYNVGVDALSDDCTHQTDVWVYESKVAASGDDAGYHVLGVIEDAPVDCWIDED